VREEKLRASAAGTDPWKQQPGKLRLAREMKRQLRCLLHGSRCIDGAHFQLESHRPGGSITDLDTRERCAPRRGQRFRERVALTLVSDRSLLSPVTRTSTLLILLLLHGPCLSYPVFIYLLLLNCRKFAGQCLQARQLARFLCDFCYRLPILAQSLRHLCEHLPREVTVPR